MKKSASFAIGIAEFVCDRSLQGLAPPRPLQLLIRGSWVRFPPRHQSKIKRRIHTRDSLNRTHWPRKRRGGGPFSGFRHERGLSGEGRRQRHEGNPNPPEGNPNFSERNPSRSGTKSKSGGTKSKVKSLHFIRFFNYLRKTNTAFSVFGPIPASKDRGNVGVACSPRVVRSVFVSVPPIFIKQVKGWRHFTIADGVLARRAGAVSARPHGRGASLRQKENPGVQGSPGL